MRGAGGVEERLHFCFRQVAPVAFGQLPKIERADAEAGEGDDGVADGEQHAAHLAIAAFVNSDVQQGARFFARHYAHFRRGGGAIVELDTVSQLRQVLLIGLSLHPGPIRFIDLMTWMCEGVREIAIIG